MKKKLLTIVFTCCILSIPVFSIVNGHTLTDILRDLRVELQMLFDERAKAQQRFEEDYERQHQKMIDVITSSNELSILLYTQEQNMTFDLAYALKKVCSEYNDFNNDRMPYDRIVDGLNVEIDRYARLVEALRRLPPMMKEIEIEILPDSLLYHNDSLEMHISNAASSLEKEVIRIAVKDSLSAPFVLDEEGEVYRDSCIRYSSELIKMYAANRATVIADSTHYQEAYWRMKESYDYAQARYRKLERYFFLDGQTPFLSILASPKYYWDNLRNDLHAQYDFSELSEHKPDESIDEDDILKGHSSRGANSMLVLICIIQLIMLVVVWAITSLLLKLLSKNARIKHIIPQSQRPIYSLFIGTIIYFLLMGFGVRGNEYVVLGARHINTFLWLLIAISGSLLLRVKPEQRRNGFRLYIPAFLTALLIIVCRVTFMPDKMMNFFFPPILFIIFARQLFFCLKERGKATPIDSVLGWISLAIYLISFVAAFMGFTFVALLILVWWYFQLAALLTIACIADLLGRYKTRWLDKHVDEMRNRITYVSGSDRESLLFGATWLYDFIRDVMIPVLALFSLPLCIRASLNVFDLTDLYEKLYNNPFVQLADKNGIETLRISFRSIVGLIALFFILKYFNRAVHAFWRYARYAAFMRKHKRTSIRDNEINLSLGNSIISVLVWMSYVVVVVGVWKIPTGSLTLVAGGLSAGIGLALKDILNNFIYGIQLMGGRLRVGDWIECDGVRGRVVAINYQCVVVETLDGTEMSFLNASLFGKNFNNLTRNNSYEFTKIIVGVAYGTDVKKVREVLKAAMDKMRTKDKYGREIVEPKYGVNVVLNDMSDSSVDIAVKQYVLVPERIGFVDRSKEAIYDALNEAGIKIPFPQCDVHLVSDDK